MNLGKRREKNYFAKTIATSASIQAVSKATAIASSQGRRTAAVGVGAGDKCGMWKKESKFNGLGLGIGISRKRSSDLP
jgi:hypothetical protein